MSDKQNILNFTGTGVIDGRKVSVNFKTTYIDFDQSDKSNPLLIVKLLPLNENELYKIELEAETTQNQEHMETYEASQTYIDQVKESDLKSGEMF